MTDGPANIFRQGLVRWVAGVQSRARAVVIAALIATVAAGIYVAENAAINTSTTDMLSEDLEFRRLSRELKEAFPQFTDNLLIVIESRAEDVADDAALALAERLRHDPGLFGEVYDLAGDPFLRRSGLLYMDPDELADLADRLAEAQPFLGALWRDPSLVGLFEMLSLAVEAADRSGPEAQGIAVAPILNAVAVAVEDMKAGSFSRLSWRRLMHEQGGDEADETVYRRFIEIQPRLDFSSLQPASEAMTAIRELGREMEIDAAHGLKLRITGSAALSGEELQSVEEGMGLAGAVSLVLVIGLLIVGLGSPALVLATVATLLMGLVWTACFAIAALGQLNLISVAFAVLFIGLSVDFGIHFALRCKEDLDNFAPVHAAVNRAASGVGGALTLSATAAAIAFYSFLPTAYRGLAELGLIAGTGMFIALFANLTVLPALIHLARPQPKPRIKGAGAMRFAVPVWVRSRPKPILVAALLLGIVGAVLSLQARFDFDPMNLRDPNTESVATILDMMADPRTSPYSITVLTADLQAADDLARRLQTLDTVDTAETLGDYVPADQDAKLEIIADMAMFLSPALSAPENAAPPTLAAKVLAFGHLFETLERFAMAAGGGEDRHAALRLLTALSGLNAPGSRATVEELERRLLQTLPGRLRDLRASLNAGPVAIGDLPEPLRARKISADGRATVDVYPSEDVHDRDTLKRFVGEVRSIAPGATGAPVVIYEAGNAVVGAFIEAAAIALTAIALLLLVLFRNLRRTLLVFVPLMLAALLTVATSAVLDLPFNFANVIVLPLLFGLGVAGAIHLVMRDMDSGPHGDMLETSTPSAVVFSALTTIASFGSIALSSHPGTASMGMLLAVALVFTMASTLLVLPALMAVWKGKP